MREMWDSFPPTVCGQPNIDHQMELLISRWHAILYPHLPRIDRFRSQIIFNCAHSFSRPTFFLFPLPVHYCNGLDLDPAFIIFFFYSRHFLCFYGQFSIIPGPAINAIWLLFLWIVKNGDNSKLFSIILPIWGFSSFSSCYTCSEIAPHPPTLNYPSSNEN